MRPSRRSVSALSGGAVDAVLDVAGVAAAGGLTSGPKETFFTPSAVASAISTSSAAAWGGLGGERKAGKGVGNWKR
jgi:hypothetical protein